MIVFEGQRISLDSQNEDNAKGSEYYLVNRAAVS